MCGLCAERLQLSPSPSTATLATCRHRLGVNEACRLCFAGPRYTDHTCTRFRPYFLAWFFIPHPLLSLSDFGLLIPF